MAGGKGRGYCLSVCMYVGLLFVWLEVRGVATVCMNVGLLFVWLEVRGVADVCLSVCMWACCLSG